MLYWEWMIGREQGVCNRSYQRGKEGSGEADKCWRKRREDKPAAVQVALFKDGTKRSRVDASWASPSVMLVVWFGVYTRDLNPVVPREGCWTSARYDFDHDQLGGVTTGQFKVNLAYHSLEFKKRWGPEETPERSRGRSYALGKEGSKSEAKGTRYEKEVDKKEMDPQREKTCMADDAVVSVYLWNDRVKAGLDYMILHNVSDEELGAAFDTIRGFLLRYWK
jgi:hypothetical protein